MKCPVCGTKVSKNNHKCPTCGHTIYNPIPTVGRITQIEKEEVPNKQRAWEAKERKEEEETQRRIAKRAEFERRRQKESNRKEVTRLKRREKNANQVIIRKKPFGGVIGGFLIFGLHSVISSFLLPKLFADGMLLIVYFVSAILFAFMGVLFTPYLGGTLKGDFSDFLVWFFGLLITGWIPLDAFF